MSEATQPDAVTKVARDLSVWDFRCPECRANPGEPCISGGGNGTRLGEPTKRPHAARSASVSKREPDPCGTYGAYQRHIRSGEKACGPCKAAAAEYAAEYRRAHPADAAHERRMNNARTRALWRLAKRYPDEFQQYVAEESA